MSNLRLALVIDALDNSGPVWTAFEKRANQAIKTIGEKVEKLGELPEKFSRGVASLGLGIGVGLEAREIFEDVERFERIGAAARIGRSGVEEFQKAIFGAAGDAGIASEALISAWDEGARHSGASMEAFSKNIGTISREIQLLGPGSEAMVGNIFGSLQQNGVESVEDVSQAFATMNRHIFESRLSLGQSVPVLNSALSAYKEMGHSGVEAFGDLNATLSTIALTSTRPREAASRMGDLLTTLESPDAWKTLGAMGITPRSSPLDPKTTRSLPDIIREMAAKSGDPASANAMLHGLGESLYTALLPMLTDIRLHGKDSVFERRLALVGDPEKEKETAADLADSPTGAFNAAQASVKKFGTALGDYSKPLWHVIRMHSEVTSGLGTLLAVVTAGTWGWKILATGLQPISWLFRAVSSGAGRLAMILGVRMVGSLPRLATILFDLGAALTGGLGRGLLFVIRLAGGALLGALLTAGEAIVAFGAALGAAPVALIVAGIAAIAGGAYLLYSHWSGFKRWWHELWSGAGDEVNETFKKIDDGATKHGPGAAWEGKARAQGFSSADFDKHAVEMRAHGFGTTDSAAANKLVAGFYNLMSKPGSAERQRRAQEAFDFFKSKGWSPEAAAGLTANIGAESSFNERAFGDAGTAYGLAQWHFDRKDAIAEHFGKAVDKMSFGEQLEAMNWELHDREKHAGDALMLAKSATEAGAIVSSLYERPAHRETEAAARGAMAEQLLRAANGPAAGGSQRVNLMVGGLPPGTKVKAENHDGEVDLGLGQHMVPAQ